MQELIILAYHVRVRLGKPWRGPFGDRIGYNTARYVYRCYTPAN